MDLGRYVVFDEIAYGGMSSVHIGRRIGPAGFGRTVAIKRLHPQYAKDPEFVSMMIGEAHVVSRIHHPNVVPTLDVVQAESELCLVMEYVPGETLARLQLLAREQGIKIPESVTFAIVTNMLVGLDAAHEATTEDGAPLGIIHRDVSPQNVLVGTDGNARILDFGIARAAGASHRSEGGQIKGKVAYMAPEQLRLDRELGRATDIYAASVVLWELLTGRRLFDRVEKSQIATLVLSGAIRSPRSVLPSISEELEEIVMRGLEPMPEQRFATAREMAISLEACGRLATAREVAEFVASIATASLASRAQIVSRIEKETATDVDVRALAARIAEGAGTSAESETVDITALDGTTHPRSPAPRRSRRALVLFGAAAAAGAVGGGFAVRHFARPEARIPVVVATVSAVNEAPSTVPDSPPAVSVEPTARRPAASGTAVKPRGAAPKSTSSKPGHGLFDRN